MGTRSLTRVVWDDEPTLCLYRQFDGYPEGHGTQLAKFLAPLRIVNGLGGDTRNVANGMGCLAAQLVAHFKSEPGNIYVYPPNSKDCGEEYVYTVSERDGKIWLRCDGVDHKGDVRETLYDGPASEWKIVEKASD